MRTTVLWIIVVSSYLLAGPGCSRQGQSLDDDEPGPERRLLFEEQFSNPSCLDNWCLEGFARLSLGGQNDTGHLEIITTADPTNQDNKQSVLWCAKPFRGNLRFEFRARGQPGNRSIFYFNANPAGHFGLESIFDWSRPDAQMTRYAGCDSIEMYSVGILRDDQEICNLRYIGGTTASAYRDPSMVTGPELPYGLETIISAYQSPFLGRPDSWFEFALEIVDGRITFEIDGSQLLSLEDPENVGGEAFGWRALTDGGWFGFRNFVPGRVDYDYLRVYQLP